MRDERTARICWRMMIMDSGRFALPKRGERFRYLNNSENKAKKGHNVGSRSLNKYDMDFGFSLQNAQSP